MAKSTPIKYTVSIGYAFNETRLDVDSLFLRSDTAVYQAKRSGKNCIKLFEELEEIEKD